MYDIPIIKLHSSSRCTPMITYILKLVLPARLWLLPAPIAYICRLWNCFCFYTRNTVVLKKSLSGKTTPKAILTPEFVHSREPWNKASWLVIKAAGHTLGVLGHTTNTSNWTNNHLQRCCMQIFTSTESLIPLLDIWEHSVEHLAFSVCKYIGYTGLR